MHATDVLTEHILHVDANSSRDSFHLQTVVQSTGVVLQFVRAHVVGAVRDAVDVADRDSVHLRKMLALGKRELYRLELGDDDHNSVPGDSDAVAKIVLARSQLCDFRDVLRSKTEALEHVLACIERGRGVRNSAALRHHVQNRQRRIVHSRAKPHEPRSPVSAAEISMGVRHEPRPINGDAHGSVVRDSFALGHEGGGRGAHAVLLVQEVRRLHSP